MSNRSSIGRDMVTGGGADTTYRQDEDPVTGARQDVRVEVSDASQYIQIQGSPEFEERVRADLDMMRPSPSRLSSSGERPPSAGLFHEFAHVYDYGNNASAPGTPEGLGDVGVENDEREAVGLPIDEDDDPNTPGQIDPDHPYSYTENAFRDGTGWPRRTSYR